MMRGAGSRRRPIALAGLLATVLLGPLALLAADAAVAQDERMRGERRRGGLVERWQSATPGERRALRAEARERWREASPRARKIQRRALRGLRRALPEFSAIERRVLLRRVMRMAPAERRALRERLIRIDELEPAERSALLGELRAMVEEESESIDRLRRNADRWQGMSESEREEYRAQMRRLREMPVEERRRLLEEWQDPARRQSARRSP